VTIVTRHRLGLGAWLMALVAAVTPAWGEPSTQVLLASVHAGIDMPARVTALTSGPARPPSSQVEVIVEGAPTAPPPDPHLPAVKTRVADREPTDLRLLVSEAERWRLVEFGAAATWHPLTARVTAFGQLPYVMSEQIEVSPGHESPQEPASLGVKGELQGFEAGAQYRSVGRRLERLVAAPAGLRDREGHELWLSQRLGLLRVKLSDSELTDNVDRNPALARTTKDQTAVTTGLAVPEWPVFELTYASGDSTRVRLTPRGDDGDAERFDFESVTGSAYYYGGPAWEASASSTFAQSRPVRQSQDETTTRSHDLSLTLRLVKAVTAVPSVHHTEERSTWSAVRTESSTAALTLSYALPATGWATSTYAGYTATRTSDGSTDGRSLSLAAALSWALGRWLPARSTVSVEASYDRYVDLAVPHSASRAVSGFVLLRVAGF
jgi:hypothetical protein